MVKPIIKIRPAIKGQPTVIAKGPPKFHAWAKVVKQPDKMEMIENEIAKFENPDQLRLSSCLYPSSAKRRSSSAWEFDIEENPPF